MPSDPSHIFCYCGKQLEDGKVSCGDPEHYKKYYEIRKKFTVDSSPYIGIGFVGFFAWFLGIGTLILGQDGIPSSEFVMIHGIISIIVPVLIILAIHYLRQKRKGLKFPWDDKDQKIFQDKDWGGKYA